MVRVHVVQVEETTLKQMLANLVIAKKAAAAAAAAEAKARREKAKRTGSASKNRDQDRQPGQDGGLPEPERTDTKAFAADDGDDWNEQRAEGDRERKGEGDTRGVVGHDEPRGRR